MADEYNLNNDQVKRAEELKNIFGDIRNATREANAALRDMGESAADYGGIYSSISNSASKVADIQRQVAKSEAGSKKVLEEKNKLQDKARRLNAQINSLYERATTATGEARKNLLSQAQNLANARDIANDVADLYGEMAEEAAKLDKSTKFFTGMKEFVGSIPGLKALSGPFDKAAEASRKVLVNAGTTKEAFAAGGKTLLGGFKSVLGPALLIKGIVELIKLGLTVDKQTTDLRKGLNLSYREAANLRAEFQQIDYNSESAFATTTRRIQELITLNKQFGTSAKSINKSIIDQSITLQEQVGLSAEQSGNLSKMFILTKDGADATVESLLGVSQVLQGQNNISLDNKKVLEEISGVTGTLRANFVGNNQALAKTVTTAQMLGLNLKSIEGIQSNLLDFEGSISSELEAELLTGKQLNLERARAAALNNDYATVAKEITSQVGTLADFQNMNAIAQEAIAKSVGMTKDSFADMLVQQDLLAKIGAKEEDSMSKRLELAIKRYGSEEAAAKALGTQAFENLKALSVQDEFNALIMQLKQTVVDIVGGPMGDFLRNLMNNKEQVEGIIEGFKGVAKFVGGIIQDAGKLKVALSAIAAILTTMAIASVTTAIASTLGVAATWLIPTIGGVVAGLGTYLSMDDGVIDSDGGMLVSGPKGSIKLNKDDQVVAGTDLFGGSGNNSRLEEKIDKLATAIMNRPTVLNVDGKRFGEVSNTTTGAYTYSLER